MRKLIYILLISLLGLSCYTTKHSSETNIDRKDAEAMLDSKVDRIQDLTEHLRKLPGLSIRGIGQDAVFTVRGVSSVSFASQPLFVLNGTAMEDYKMVYKLVNMNDFESARLLKNASETAFYGSRGSNGVIVINTKN